MNRRQGTRHRGAMMRSSSTGSGLDDYVPAETTRYLAAGGPKPRNNNKGVTYNADALGRESMDDIGVAGVKPRVNAARNNPNESEYSQGSRGIAKTGTGDTRRRRMSLVDAGLMARRGVQETVEAAGQVAAKIKTKGIMDALGTFAMQKISFDERAAWNARLTSPLIRVAIFAQCRQLPSRTTRHANAFCVLWEVPSGYTGCVDETGRPCQLPRNEEREIGRSEVIHDSENPIFLESISVEYRFEVDQWFLMRIYDKDLEYSDDLKEHDYFGGFAFQLGDLMGRPSHKQLTRLESETDAILILKGRELEAAKQFLEFRIAAQALQTVDSFLSKTVDSVMTVDPFFMLERRHEDDDSWVSVWKSEVVFHDRNPTWGAASLSLLEICGGDLDEEMRVTFWESQNHGPNEFLGYTETTVRDLINTPEDGQMLPIKCRKNIFFGAGTKLQTTGKMKILRAVLKDKTTFLQYLHGGCEIDLILAVDCGSTINHADEKKASHFVHGKWLNNYQAAIGKIGTVMEAYSRSHPFKMFGYNANASIDQTDTFFSMGDKIRGKDGMLKAYEKYFLKGNRFLTRHKDSHLAPMITETIFEAIQSTKTRQCYTVLCILTSGHVSDLQATVDALLRAATDAPLSVVFVGCEDHSLDGLKRYYAKTKVQRSINGIRLSRDNTSFSSFKECLGDPTRVASDALHDISEQVVQRFYQEGIKPKPAPNMDPANAKNVHKDKQLRHHHHHHRGGGKSPDRSRRKKGQSSKSPDRGHPKKL